MTTVYPTLAGLSLPIKRTPEWDTDVQVSIAGKRTAYGRRSFPRYKWELTYQFLRSSTASPELQTLQAFYNFVGGRRDVFQWTDPEDNAATTQAFGIGDGTTQAFQLVRTMLGTGFSFVEPVFAPVTASIFVNAVLQTLTVDYTISNTGSVTFTVAPVAAAALTWTGTFNYYCRFDQDEADFEKMYATALWEIKRVQFSSELF